jgi:RNA polymerase sigma factor (sigma-70 family)
VGVADDDRVEFTRFYEDNRDACLRAVTAHSGDRVLAEDLVAESFARAWACWPKVSRHPAPQAWVVRTALNTRVSWWRKRQREVPLAGLDQSGILAPDSSTPADSPDPALMAALRALPTRQREVFTWRVLLDLDTETTAKVLGIAPGTVMSHLSRAIAALRRTLTSPDGQPNDLEISHE